MTKRRRPEKPVLPILNVEMANLATPEGYSLAILRVLSLMLHPRDDVARRSFVASAAYDVLDHHAARMSPPRIVTISGKPREVEIRPVEKILAEAMAPRLNRKGAKGRSDAHDPYAGPSVAAAILNRAFALAEGGWPEAGIAQVLSEHGEALKAEGVVGAGRDNLAEVWHEYRPVAHIAAAFGAVQGRSLQDRRVFFDWIGLAQDILKIGGAIGSRFAAPILPPDECWRIVLTPTALGRGLPEFFSDGVLSTPRPPWSQ